MLSQEKLLPIQGTCSVESPMGSFPLPHTESSTLTTLAARAIRCHSSFTRDRNRFLQCWKIAKVTDFPDPPEDITGIDFLNERLKDLGLNKL